LVGAPSIGRLAPCTTPMMMCLHHTNEKKVSPMDELGGHAWGVINTLSHMWRASNHWTWRIALHCIAWCKVASAKGQRALHMASLG
jgi:hypothetical protein